MSRFVFALFMLSAFMAQPAGATLMQYRIAGVIASVDDGMSSLGPPPASLVPGTEVGIDFVYDDAVRPSRDFEQRVEYPAILSFSIQIGDYESGVLTGPGVGQALPFGLLIACTVANAGLCSERVEGYTIFSDTSAAPVLDGRQPNALLVAMPSLAPIEVGTLPPILPPAISLNLGFGPQVPTDFFVDVQVTSGPFAVPEPSTAACLMLGLALLSPRRRR